MSWYSPISSSSPSVSSEEDEKKTSFVEGRQPTRVELEWVRDGGGLGEERSRRREDGRHDYWWRRHLKKTPTRRHLNPQSQEDKWTYTLRERERLWVYCFNWVAALGHRGGQEFGPLPLWPLTVTAFFCVEPLFYISLSFTTLCYFTTSLFPHCWEG